MFGGLKAGKGKGGKGGKGKSGGKGGINVIVKEDRGSDDDDPDSDRELGVSNGRLALGRMTAAASPQQRKRGEVSSPARFTAPSPAQPLPRNEVVKIGCLTPTASASRAVPTPPFVALEEKVSPSRIRRAGGSTGRQLSDMESGERTDGSSSSSARRRRHDKRQFEQSDVIDFHAAPPLRVPAVSGSNLSPLSTFSITNPMGGSPAAVAPGPPPVGCSVTYRADGRPSLVFSLPLSRVSRAGAVLISNFRGQQPRQPGGLRPGRDKKGGGKELWFTRPSSNAHTLSSNEAASRAAKKRSGTVDEASTATQYQRNPPTGRTSREETAVINGSDRLVSPLPAERPLSRSATGWDGSGRPASALRERRDSGGSSRSSSSSHRKQVERTHSPLEEDMGGGDSFHSESAAAHSECEASGLYERKRGRHPSPGNGSAKRFRPEDEVEGGEKRGWQAGGPAMAHPTFLPSTPELGGLMPPPSSTVPVYYSYFER